MFLDREMKITIKKCEKINPIFKIGTIYHENFLEILNMNDKMLQVFFFFPLFFYTFENVIMMFNSKQKNESLFETKSNLEPTVEHRREILLCN